MDVSTSNTSSAGRIIQDIKMEYVMEATWMGSGLCKYLKDQHMLC